MKVGVRGMEASVPVRKKEYFEPGECPVPLYLWGIKRVPVPITVENMSDSLNAISNSFFEAVLN